MFAAIFLVAAQASQKNQDRDCEEGQEVVWAMLQETGRNTTATPHSTTGLSWWQLRRKPCAQALAGYCLGCYVASPSVKSHKDRFHSIHTNNDNLYTHTHTHARTHARTHTHTHLSVCVCVHVMSCIVIIHMLP